VTIWGAIRPGIWGTVRDAIVDFQFTARTSGTFAAVRAVQTANPEGYFVAHVDIPGPGSMRITWQAPNGIVFHSRTVQVS
jgi:hypothetical protein